LLERAENKITLGEKKKTHTYIPGCDNYNVGRKSPTKMLSVAMKRCLLMYQQ